jgi:flagellar hook-associated protein 1 FlgK
MADLLGIGISSLLANQRALATTSHNIANVETEGYSRQRTEFITRPANYTGTGFIGTGVRTASIQRLYDTFLATQARMSTSGAAESGIFLEQARQIDGLLTDADTGLAPVIQNFFNAVQQASNDPVSLAARQALLGDAEALTGRFRLLQQQLDHLGNGINTEIVNVTEQINGLARGIAALNTDIASATARGTPPNDLLDQRDALMDQLAAKVALSSVQQDDGSINLFIGSGQGLVVGGSVAELLTVNNDHDPQRLEIAMRTGAGTMEMSGAITGGQLGGLLDFRTNMLDKTENTLGQIAQALVSGFNEQHARGMDLDGALGQDFFAIAAPAVLPDSDNSGSGTVSATVDDVNALTLSDYRVSYQGAGNWSVTRLADNTSVSGGGPLLIDGMTINVGGAPATGDNFALQPTRSAAGSIGISLTGPEQLALAAPIRTQSASANSGSAIISAGEVVDVSDADLLDPITISFISPLSYSIDGGPALAYTSGSPIDYNGWRVNISGIPAAGDSFSVSANNGGVGDNRNARRLTELQSARILNGGKSSMTDAYGQLLTRTGSMTASVSMKHDALEALNQHAVASRDAVSGVNLEEEAASLLRFQQAFQASAQVINIANQLFDTVMQAVRR